VIYSKSSINYSWVFYCGEGGTSSSLSGTMSIDGLNSGAQGVVWGVLNATITSLIATQKYIQIASRTKTEVKDENGKGTGEYVYGAWTIQSTTATGSPSYATGSTTNLGSVYSNFLTFYTRPSPFLWGETPETGKFIEDWLTAKDWNILMDKAVQKYNWKNCQPGSDIEPKTTPQNHVASGDWVTAVVYNTGAELCGLTTRVDPSTKDQALSNAVNSD
jgi:hypothetical protein